MKTLILATVLLAGSSFVYGAPTTRPASRPAARPAAVKPPTTFTDRAKAENKSPHGTGRMPADVAKANLQYAAKIDAAIQAYLGSHVVADDIALAMWAGQIKPGMTEDQVGTFGIFTVDSETERSKTGRVAVPDFYLISDAVPWRVTIEGGRITSVEHPR